MPREGYYSFYLSDDGREVYATIAAEIKAVLGTDPTQKQVFEAALARARQGSQPPNDLLIRERAQRLWLRDALDGKFDYLRSGDGRMPTWEEIDPAIRDHYLTTVRAEALGVNP